MGEAPRRAAGAGLMPQTDIAILNWRREKSVFLGTNQPQEDASWIFQLRMAELERAKTGRTSEPRPWNRLGARMFDYAFWGIVLALLLSELRRAGIVPETVNYWLAHPLMAPVIITGTWVGVETLLMASVGTTPGKWLFGCYVQYLDLRRVRPARNEVADLAQLQARVPGVVGRHGLRFPAHRADPDRHRLRAPRAEPRERLGLRAGLPCNACAAWRAQHGDGRLRPRRDAVALRRRVAPAARGFDRQGGDVDHRRDAVGAIDHSEGTDRRKRDHQRDRRHPRSRQRRAGPGAGSPEPRRSTPTSRRCSPTVAPASPC